MENSCWRWSAAAAPTSTRRRPASAGLGAPRRGATRVEGPSSPLSPPDTEADHAAAAGGARSVSRDGDVGNGAESAAATPSAFTSLDGLMAKHGVKAPSEIFDEAMRLRSGAGGHRKRRARRCRCSRYWRRRGAPPKLPASNATAAARELGFMHLHGEGTVSDAAAAVHYFETAADSGDADAQHALGVLYSTGFGVHRDPSSPPPTLLRCRAAASRHSSRSGADTCSAFRRPSSAISRYSTTGRWRRRWWRRRSGSRAVARSEKVRLTLDNPKGVSKRGADDDTLSPSHPLTSHLSPSHPPPPRARVLPRGASKDHPPLRMASAICTCTVPPSRPIFGPHSINPRPP